MVAVTTDPPGTAQNDDRAPVAENEDDRAGAATFLFDDSRKHRGQKGSFSEKMAVPSFGAKGTGDELGMSARSYLRQVEAWSKVTRTDPTQQALLLYQNLSGRAWVESEELNVDDLASSQGLKIFKSWIRERYQEVEVSRIAEALTLFFKKMKRQAGQSIRGFNSVFDRGHSRLLEIDCRLPEVARAWAYLNALGLSNSEELSLLASVGNDYSTAKLQKAAILHEKSLRGPWVPRNKGEGKGAKSAFLTGTDNDEPQHGFDDDRDDDETGTCLPEEAAIEIHEAFVAQESAKACYRDIVKARGVDPENIKHNKKNTEDAVVAVTGIKMPSARLTDLVIKLPPRSPGLAKEIGVDTQFLDCHDDFRFGASRLFHANFSATIVIQIRDRVFMLRASVVQGEVPLLMSRSALSQLGMVYDLEGHAAQFKHLGIERFSLMTTDSGHPAIPVTPKRVPGMKWPSPQEWASSEVIIVPSAASQYTTFMTSASDAKGDVISSSSLDPKENKTPSADHPPGQNLFYPKKINACVRNLLCAEDLNLQLFAAWWSKTPISKDFWIECPESFIRIHVVPRRGLFDPSRWETSQIETKDKLLGSVGLIRSSHGISCSTLAGLDAIHDLWQDQRDAQQPVLWVGRSVFSRAVSRAPLCGPPPVVSAPALPDGFLKSAPQHLEDEQDAVDVRGSAAEPDGALFVVGGRDQADPQRPPEGIRPRVECPKRVSFDDPRTAEDTSLSSPDPHPTEGHQGADATTREKAEAIVTFGRHKDKLYKEVPTQYLEWAMMEVGERGAESSGPDLVSLANYAKAKLQPEETESYNPEVNSKVPLPPESSADSCWESHWSELTETVLQLNARVNNQKKGNEAQGYQRQPTPKKRSTATGSHTGEKQAMEQEVPPEVREEIETLMSRLAALKDRHGL
ncbi:GIP [Symbiodinium sp. KB8]|nr:GIP [Symbiodinium sp. KB8]